MTQIDGMTPTQIRNQMTGSQEEAVNWMETARQYAQNADFYQDIVRQIGEMFGVEAYTSDDGSIQDDVLALKVPELVQQMIETYGRGDE